MDHLVKKLYVDYEKGDLSINFLKIEYLIVREEGKDLIVRSNII